MGKSNRLKDEIEVSKNFGMLARSYQQHAIEQINFARFSVVGSREFATELQEIFLNVRYCFQSGSYHKSGKKKRMPRSFSGTKNGKEAFVLLSANNKLYGDIVERVCQIFVEKSKNSNADLIVIGSRGKGYLDESGLNKNYTYFEITDTNIDIASLKRITSVLVNYEKVIVFYAKFQNIISQLPTVGYLSGSLPQQGSQGKDESKFIFEPDISEIMQFFESQIFSILLNQTVQEGQLARFASRINAMEKVQDNIKKRLVTLDRKEKKQKLMEMNKEQQQLMAGKMLWGGK